MNCWTFGPEGDWMALWRWWHPKKNQPYDVDVSANQRGVTFLVN